MNLLVLICVSKSKDKWYNLGFLHVVQVAYAALCITALPKFLSRNVLLDILFPCYAVLWQGALRGV